MSQEWPIPPANRAVISSNAGAVTKPALLECLFGTRYHPVVGIRWGWGLGFSRSTPGLGAPPYPRFQGTSPYAPYIAHT